MFEGKIILEPFELCLAECFKVGIGFSTADDGGEGDKKDFFEGIFDSTGPSSGMPTLLIKKWMCCSIEYQNGRFVQNGTNKQFYIMRGMDKLRKTGKIISQNNLRTSADCKHV